MVDQEARAKLVALVTRIMSGDYTSEAELDEDVRRLEAAVLDPNVSNLIFWHKPELSPDEVVDKALAYRPFAL